MGSEKSVLWLQAAGISTAPGHPLESLCSLARHVQTEQVAPHQTWEYFVLSAPYQGIPL